MNDAPKAIYLNNASANDIAKLDGMTANKASAIVEARPFTDWSDLNRVKGLESSEIDTIRSQGAELGDTGSGPIGEPGSGGPPRANQGRA
jgi:hypothetical protein